MDEILNSPTLLQKAKLLAIDYHGNTNHLYDGQPYYIHLDMVDNVGKDFIRLIPEVDRQTVRSACWLHDTIEDTRKTWNDIKSEMNEQIADIVYALTNEKGKTRKERANDKYYEGIRNTPYATFVKICDRIANIEYSKKSGSSMFKKYMKEHDEFKKQLFTEEYSVMWAYLEGLFKS
jgi:(p)ppGpp synthase/HD superfamily hydrolase